MISVAVILISYNSHEYTLTCLATLAKSKLDGIKLKAFVVDNASQELFTLENVPEELDVEVLRSDKNLGFTGGNNLAIEQALQQNFEYLLILNNDTRVDSLAVQHLVEFAQSHDQVGVVSPMIYFEKGREFHSGYDKTELGKVVWFAGGSIDWQNMYAFHRGVDEVDRGQFELSSIVDEKERSDGWTMPLIDYSTMDFATGCCMLIPSAVLREVGAFDDSYFLYWEDVDLSHRIRQAGYQLYFCPQAKIWHANAGSSGGSGSTLHQQYQERNRKKFAWKYAPLRTKLHLLLK